MRFQDSQQCLQQLHIWQQCLADETEEVREDILQRGVLPQTMQRVCSMPRPAGIWQQFRLWEKSCSRDGLFPG